MLYLCSLCVLFHLSTNFNTFFSIGSLHSGRLSVHHAQLALHRHTLDHILKTYQLFQIPATDLHVALILVQTLRKLLRIHFTASRSPGVILLVTGLSNTIILLLLCRGLRGSTTKEPPDGMPDRRTYGYTSVFSMLV